MKYKRAILFFTILLVLFFFNVNSSLANDFLQNNKFGMSLLQPTYEDFKKTAELVNSKGGDWGYVTLVIQEDDTDVNKWQDIFDQLREFRLIPIVRIATKPENDYWRRPNKDDADRWVEFLDSLHWVVKNRYIVLFNEPNHAKEWGNKINPEDYGEVSLLFAKKLKAKNKDFFIMLAGFDASAPSVSPNYEDEEFFLRRMFKKENIKEWNNVLDGWSSHSYPNPGFSGSPWDWGRKSIRGYQWELKLLRNIGITKNLPVFITETGWSDEALSRESISLFFKQAFVNVWNIDSRVVAVTPFVFNYQSAPFLSFSWKKQNSDEYYPQYYEVKSLFKNKGNPEIEEDGNIYFSYPKELVSSSTYHFIVRLENKGQAIWDKDYGYYLKLNEFKGGEYFFSDLNEIKPHDTDSIDLYIKTKDIKEQIVKNNINISLFKDNKEILNLGKWNYEIVPLPSLHFETFLFPKKTVNASDFEVQIFDEKEDLIFKKKNIRVRNGSADISKIQNIVLGDKYRIVLLKQYYLPRQKIVEFKRGKNEISFEKMIPLDFNIDGTFNEKDFFALFENLSLIKLLIP